MFFSILLPILFLTTTFSLLIPQQAKRSLPVTKANPPSETSLLEVGHATHLKQAAANRANIKIISYNIRWRGGEDLQELIDLLRDHSRIGGGAVLGLQEVDRQKKRTKNVNTVKLIADQLGMHYAWTAPPTAKAEQEEETGVAILSPYPLSDIKRIVLPHEGPGHRRRVALGATVTNAGTAIRFYSVHSETRIPVERKLEQFQAVLDDLARYPASMPAVVAGDFNTWEASSLPRTRKLFSQANFQTPFDNDSTFSRNILFFPLELKLDWIWLRGLESVENGIEQKIKLSDHWPLWCITKLKT